mmetsp:Transcript_44248/g.137241  ORF Transcript_44248/g.137241 Transcript_44248/m.137241 type:complete len:520 (+) Transcript_44248:182-1741(+)
MPAPWATTLLVENLPLELRSDAALRSCFDDAFQREVVETAYVVRRSGSLAALMQQAERARQQLREAEDRWERCGAAPDQRPTHSSAGQKVDSIFSYADEKRKAEQSVEEALERVRRAVNSAGSSIMSSAGFVTFRHRCDTMMALKIRIGHSTGELALSLPPEPQDVIYDDLQRMPGGRIGKEFAGYLCISGLFISFMPITIGIISITRLKTLQQLIPLFDMIVRRYPRMHAFWDGMMGSLIMNLAIGFVPTILVLIFRGFFVLKSEAWCQQRVQRWYFYFQVIFVLLFTAVGSSLALVYLELIEDPARIFLLLASSLPGASHFYLKYFMLQWAVESMILTRYMILLKFIVFRRAHGDVQARELSEPEDQDYEGIGARSARLTLLLVLALVFSTISPPICLLSLVHFGLCRLSYGYLLVFAESRKPDSGGAIWVAQLKHLQQGLFLFVAIMVGILLARAESTRPGLFAASSFGLLFGSHLRFRGINWELLPLEEAATWDLQRPTPEAPAGAYRQPELAGL